MKVKLWMHVKGSGESVCIERIIDLPFTPWAGLEITGLTTESSDMTEHIVQTLRWDLAAQCFVIRLVSDDSDDTGRTSQQIVDAEYPEWSPYKCE